MDILRQLTRKFRAQDINERSSLQSSTTGQQMQKEDDVFDSGTASDEEIAGIFLPQLRAVMEDTLNGKDDLSKVANDLDSTSRSSSWSPVPPTSAQHGLLTTNKFLSTSASLLSSFGHRMDSFPIVASGAPTVDGRHSVTSSDYERCSLDFEASSSSSELGFHSSEEELASINRDEKRKRSQLSDDSSVFSDDDDDDEVHKLFRGDDDLLFHSLSVRLADAPVPTSGSEMGLGSGRGVSPLKRHRRDCLGLSGGHHRPSLDFYKMQKTCIVRKHHTLKRPRLVKLWIVNGSQRPSKTTFDPSPFCFRSLSWTPTSTDSNSPHHKR